MRCVFEKAPISGRSWKCGLLEVAVGCLFDAGNWGAVVGLVFKKCISSQTSSAASASVIAMHREKITTCPNLPTGTSLPMGTWSLWCRMSEAMIGALTWWDMGTGLCWVQLDMQFHRADD